jgi:hypothetical protein
MLQKAVPILGYIGVATYDAAAIWAASVGVTGYFGIFGGGALLICLLFLRFTPPVAVAAFIGALKVWHLHWAIALLFAGQGLVLLGPPVLAALLASLPWWFRRDD